MPVRSVSSTATPSGPALPPSQSRPVGAHAQRTHGVHRRRAQSGGASALAQTLAHEFDFRFLVGVLSVLGDKDVDGILAALEPVFDSVVVTHNGSPRALDVEALALAAGERFGPDRVRTAENLRDAIDVATSLVDDAAADPDVAGDAFSRTGIVITGSVVTAGAARTLFGRDPQ